MKKKKDVSTAIQCDTAIKTVSIHYGTERGRRTSKTVTACRPILHYVAPNASTIN